MSDDLRDTRFGGIVSDTLIDHIEKAMEGTDGVVLSTARYKELEAKAALAIPADELAQLVYKAAQYDARFAALEAKAAKYDALETFLRRSADKVREVEANAALLEKAKLNYRRHSPVSFCQWFVSEVLDRE